MLYIKSDLRGAKENELQFDCQYFLCYYIKQLI